MPLGVITGYMRRRLRRVPTKGRMCFTTKMSELKGFYKGKGVINYGRLSTKGGFILEMHKLPKFVVPDLTGFKLKPYVAHNTPKIVSPEKLAKAESSAAGRS